MPWLPSSFSFVGWLDVGRPIEDTIFHYFLRHCLDLLEETGNRASLQRRVFERKDMQREVKILSFTSERFPVEMVVGGWIIL